MCDFNFASPLVGKSLTWRCVKSYHNTEFVVYRALPVIEYGNPNDVGNDAGWCGLDTQAGLYGPGGDPEFESLVSTDSINLCAVREQNGMTSTVGETVWRATVVGGECCVGVGELFGCWISKGPCGW